VNNAVAGTPPGAISYDAGLQVFFDATQSSATSYCAYFMKGNFEYYKKGPTGVITADATPGATPCA
jgi:hypothetical protein